MTLPLTFPGKLAIQQRVLTPYRAAFFDALAEACVGGVNVCAGLPRPEESIAITDQLVAAQFTRVHNLHLLGGRFYACHQQGLLPWLQVCDPDALILEANPRYLAAPAARRWMQRRGRAVIGWGLGAPPLHGRLGGWQAARREAFLHSFDALITYSRCGAGEYAALGFPTERIFVAPNAAARRPASAPAVRQDRISGRPTVLFVGRLQRRKRIDLLLRACASLPVGLQPRLVIVGDGPEGDALQAQAQEVYPGAEFTGARHGAALAETFAAADLFVLPGTGGLAVQEAMSHALPVIMGKGDGTNDDLVQPTNGWQIPEDDPAALNSALAEALSDLPRLRRMGAESQRIVREEINLETMVEVFVAAIRAVTA